MALLTKAAKTTSCAVIRQSTTRRLASTSTSQTQLSGLKINSTRLWETLHETCEWGAAHRYGEYVNPTNLTSFYHVS